MTVRHQYKTLYMPWFGTSSVSIVYSVTLYQDGAHRSAFDWLVATVVGASPEKEKLVPPTLSKVDFEGLVMQASIDTGLTVVDLNAWMDLSKDRLELSYVCGLMDDAKVPAQVYYRKAMTDRHGAGLYNLCMEVMK